jgi:UDP-N-acetyl-D-glucosamine dehydrogenase
VSYHDPYIATVRDEDGHGESNAPVRLRHSVALTDEALAAADAVVIVTDHKVLDYQRIVDKAGLVVDTRNATAKTKAGRAHVVALSGTSAADSDAPVLPAMEHAPALA